jgi:hypothetical protein
VAVNLWVITKSVPPAPLRELHLVFLRRLAVCFQPGRHFRDLHPTRGHLPREIQHRFVAGRQRILVAASAVRLLPSTKGWFLMSEGINAAALLHKSG